MASCSPAGVVRATAPVKREPTMLSKIRVCAGGDLALGMHGGKPRRDARAGRRAVDLGLGKHADILGRPVGEGILAVGQDRAIEEGEIVMIGMRQREFRLQLLRQRRRGIDEIAHAVAAERQAELAAVGQRVEGAAIGHVECDLAVALELRRLVAGQQESRHALERYRAGAAVARPRPRRRPCRTGIRC